MTKRNVALPFLAGAALLGVLWFSFRDHDPQEARALKAARPQGAASVSTQR